MKLGGLVCVRNGDELDYCWREAVKSLLPVCEVVTICDGESTDGTQEEIRKWMLDEPKLNLCVYPWPNPKGDSDFWVKWLQYGRMHSPSDYILQLDADEVLDDCSHGLIEFYKKSTYSRFTVKMERLNFWRDHRHLIPSGVCCSDVVIRMGPQDVWLPSDGIHEKGAEWVNMAREGTSIRIFHYGFLRKREQWFKKAKALQNYFFATYDPRLAAAEKHEGNWSEMPGVTGWENNLVKYDGQHPHIALNWLRERGYF
jgi:glycosyltransferase involved in cell wall biosynthesis